MLGLVLLLNLQLHDPYAVACHLIRERMYRSAVVLLQELAYRSRDTERVRQYFGSLHDVMSGTIREPMYSFGFLWPHETAVLEWSPYEERPVGFKPPWSILRAPHECVAVLDVPRFGRVLEPSAAWTATSQPGEPFACVPEVIHVAEVLLSRRLVAALICDLTDRGDLRGLEELANSTAFRALASDPIPPGCDMTDVAWSAFRATLRHEAPSIEPTFQELMARSIAVTLPTGAELSAAQVTMRKLNQGCTAAEFQLMPFRSVFSFVCEFANVKDNTAWDELTRRGFAVDKEIDFIFVAGARWQTMLNKVVFLGLGQQARLIIDENGGVVCSPTDPQRTWTRGATR